MEPTKHYTLEKKYEVYYKDFKTKGQKFKLRVNKFDKHEDYGSVVRTLNGVITDVLEELKAGIPAHDRVALSLESARLNNGIWLPFMTPPQLTTDRIMKEVEGEFQINNKEWLFEDWDIVRFSHVEIPADYRP